MSSFCLQTDSPRFLHVCEIKKIKPAFFHRRQLHFKRFLETRPLLTLVLFSNKIDHKLLFSCKILLRRDQNVWNDDGQIRPLYVPAPCKWELSITTSVPKTLAASSVQNYRGDFTFIEVDISAHFSRDTLKDGDRAPFGTEMIWNFFTARKYTFPVLFALPSNVKWPLLSLILRVQDLAAAHGSLPEQEYKN